MSPLRRRFLLGRNELLEAPDEGDPFQPNHTAAQTEEYPSNAADSEEVAEPKIHPAAADGVTVEVPDDPEEKYFIGMWGDLRNYGCPYCPYATIGSGEGDGNGTVELHILSKIDAGDIKHRAALVIEE